MKTDNDLIRQQFEALLKRLGFVSKELYSKYELNIAFEVFKAAIPAVTSEPKYYALHKNDKDKTTQLFDTKSGVRE